jgi:hypothetical protein
MATVPRGTIVKRLLGPARQSTRRARKIHDHGPDRDDVG